MNQETTEVEPYDEYEYVEAEEVTSKEIDCIHLKSHKGGGLVLPIAFIELLFATQHLFKPQPKSPEPKQLTLFSLDDDKEDKI
jgi:hypothetical protein